VGRFACPHFSGSLSERNSAARRATNDPHQGEARPAKGQGHAQLVIRSSIEVPGADPWVFLRAFDGAPRGFWAWGVGWIAHAGVIHEIEVPWEAGSDATNGAVATDDPKLDTVRFKRVRAAAQPGDETPLERLRWFGGFSFGQGHEPVGRWSSFPPARFQRPLFELESDGRVVHLTAWTTPGAEEDADEARERLTDGLGRLAEALLHGDSEPASDVGVRPRPPSDAQRKAWEGMVQRALDRFQSSDLAKVVLARSVDVEVDGYVDPVSVVRRLREQNPRARVFLFEPEPGSAFMGASPETLARLVNGSVGCTAVAGSIPRGNSPEADRVLANSLLGSEKDMREHQFVVDDMVERLSRWGDPVEVDLKPAVLPLSRIQHLVTRIRARVPEGTDVLDLIADLHPTPAVCGRSRDDAFAFLVSEETFDRGWYGGPVGWFDAAGNGIFAPALRCALAREGVWRVFAGGGIVPGSEPEREWDETHLKLQTALGALADTTNTSSAQKR